MPRRYFPRREKSFFLVGEKFLLHAADLVGALLDVKPHRHPGMESHSGIAPRMGDAEVAGIVHQIGTSGGKIANVGSDPQLVQQAADSKPL